MKVAMEDAGKAGDCKLLKQPRPIGVWLAMAGRAVYRNLS